MQFARLRGPMRAAPAKNKPNEWVSKTKSWLWPQTAEGRKARLSQYKDVGIFVGSIVIMYLFKDKLADLLEINPQELRKLSEQQAMMM